MSAFLDTVAAAVVMTGGYLAAKAVEQAVHMVHVHVACRDFATELDVVLEDVVADWGGKS